MFAQRNDWDTLAARFAEDQRLRLEGALSPELAVEFHNLIANIPYALMITENGAGKALSPAELEQIPPEKRKEIQQRILTEASQGQGFLYEGHQLKQSATPALQDVLARINAPETLERVRQLTGMDDITHADGQATRYRAGHFLTRHVDDPEGEERRLAYVISLSRQWHPDWGGLLQFYEMNGTPRDAWSPEFNTMAMFNTRHVHSVTYVTPFAAAPRLSITGWFRAGEPK